MIETGDFDAGFDLDASPWFAVASGGDKIVAFEFKSANAITMNPRLLNDSYLLSFCCQAEEKSRGGRFTVLEVDLYHPQPDQWRL